MSAPQRIFSYPTVEPSEQPQDVIDPPYQSSEPFQFPLPPRQQQNPTPLSQRRPSAAAGSTSSKSLRRTPRLQERRATSLQSPPLPAQPQQAVPRPGHASTQADVKQPVRITQSGSTTPESFQRLVEDESYWPKRQTRISRRTHEAILFALEAIRSGGGVNAHKLTSHRSEEEARMSELYSNNPMEPSRTTQPEGRMQTPQQVMAARRAREAKRAEEAIQRQTQENDPTRRRAEDVVGGVPDRRQQQQFNRPTTTEAQSASRYNAGQSITIGGRNENIPTTNGIGPNTGNRVVNQGQPRPVVQPQTQPQQNTQIPADDPRYTTQVQRDRTEAYEKLSIPAAAGATKPPQPQAANYPQPSGAAPQPQARTAFPHAFERWETLSSHWEGLTSYWIRRLQENTNELDGKPIDKQMARQITDLSAAGANLFQAVIVLQGLRASSERKFQRWFFETRNEQEAAQEKIAELQAQIQELKQTQVQQVNDGPEMEVLRTEKSKADELVKEMRRELQISKEEARRAWEELGRREQDEREKTAALKSGEPTVIGGVQVLPMQGLSSRHNTTASQRPVTRDGPYPGGPGPNLMSGQQAPSRSRTDLESPERGQGRYAYPQATTSPTDTDPFTESARPTEPPVPLRHEPDTRFLSSGSPRNPPGSSYNRAAAVASPHSHQSQSAYNRTNASEGASYIPSTRSSDESEEEYHRDSEGNIIRDPQGRPVPYRQPLGAYVEVASDDEDHTADIERERLLAQEYPRRQQQQQSSRGPSPAVVSQSQQLPSTTYSRVTSPPDALRPGARPSTTPPQTQQTPMLSGTSPEEAYYSTASTTNPVTPQQPMTGRLSSPMRDPSMIDYSGAGYGSFDEAELTPVHASGNVTSSSQTPGVSAATGWEQIQTATPRHQHPTRLSDIVEEGTSLSRGSYASNENNLAGGTRR